MAYSDEGTIPSNEFDRHDVVNIDSSNGLLKYYRPQYLVNDLAQQSGPSRIQGKRLKGIALKILMNLWEVNGTTITTKDMKK